MAGSLTLDSLSEKVLQQTADPNLITYCPSMELVALATTDQQVLIYRLNGQRVYGAAQKTNQLKVQSIRWKPNGNLLAIAWSDGSVRLVGAESTKIVHQFSTGDAVSGVTCMGWASNLTGRSSKSERESDARWEEIIGDENNLAGNKIPLDLPRDLSLIDIETSMPKLSVLPAGGSSDDVFCSRASLDALFRPFDPKLNNAVDVMVIGTESGQVHVSIYDSFVIGSFSCPSTPEGEHTRLLKHSSHENCSTHTLLMQSFETGKLYLVPMDLRFISASSDYLSLLAFKSTNLDNLLRYISQVQELMISEWKSATELPGKFLRNINETLGETNHGGHDIVQALYHSVATGHTFPAVKEWLVDELAERGHKRWEKVVVTGLENLRRLVHENLLPALERCSVILSRFSGIAKFQGPNDTLGFSSQQIGLIMDTVACLHLVASRILLQIVDELDLFGAFSAWLRFEIDRLASESSSTKEDELEKEAAIDHSKVLQYLQNCMIASPLEVYLGDCTSEDYSHDWNHAEQGLSMFELLDKQLQKQEKGGSYMKPLPRVELLCKLLSRQARTIFAQIAEAEKRNVLLGHPQEIGITEDDALIDMQTLKASAFFNARIAFVPKSMPGSIQLSNIRFEVANGISRIQRDLGSTAIHFEGGRIKDIKLYHDYTFVLFESKDNTKLLKIPVSGFKEWSQRSIQPSKYDDPAIFPELNIPNGSTFVPERIELRGLNDEDLRLVVLGKDRLHYRVFKLPARTHGADEDISMS